MPTSRPPSLTLPLQRPPPQITRAYSATDPSGNIATASYVITVSELPPGFPVFDSVPPDMTLECASLDVLPAPNVTARPSGGASPLTVAFSQVSEAGSCVNNYTRTLSWTATNAGMSQTANRVRRARACVLD